MNTVRVRDIEIGPKAPLAIIAGPCVAESRELCLTIGSALRDRCAKLGFTYIFKASFDKANRTSIRSARGPGVDAGLRLLESVGAKLGVPVTTDIHEPGHARSAAQAVDLLQIPAFLCRQTDLLVAAARTGRAVNVKKGQFLSPQEMGSVVQKLEEGFADLAKPQPKRGARAGGGGKPHAGAGAARTAPIILTERGTFFGYQRLVNDFIGLGDMMELGYPVCFDVTHSTQLPGAGGGPKGSGRVTAGRPERAPLLARCAVAAGVQALFIETHPQPARGASDAATMLPLELTLALLVDLARLHAVVRS